MALARQAQPLIHLLREHQHRGQFIAMDETVLQVLKEPERPATTKKYMWVSLSGLPEQQSVLFDYDPSRSASVPVRLLDGYTNGYLQTDGYAGYSSVCQTNQLIQVGCWDHARRKFVEAAADKPKKSKGKVSSRQPAPALPYYRHPVGKNQSMCWRSSRNGWITICPEW